MAPMRQRFLLPALLLAAACDKPARVEFDPPTLRFGVRGQSAKIHATPVERDGRPIPKEICRWSSSEERVATATGPHNEATVTAVGPGNAMVRCTISGGVWEVPVSVRVVSRIAVRPSEVDLKMKDDPEPVALRVEAYDDTGAPVLGRVVTTHCADERICRGDARGQLWGVSQGTTTALVEVEAARAEIPVRVVDARTAEGKPRRVKGNPMLEIEREVRRREAEAAKEKARAARQQAKAAQ
jgi:hypothetical protein